MLNKFSLNIFFGLLLSCHLSYALSEPAKPYNIILIISDQQAYHLQPTTGYRLVGHESLQQHGVTFTRHYAAAAMCSPSRAALLTGTPPQINKVSDQMGYPYTPTLNPNQPNMGSALKSLGYRTAYFGKFEMDKAVLKANSTVNTSTAIQPYGFDIFNPDGDTSGSPRQGYYGDPYYVGEAIRWLHDNATSTNTSTKPFFMVISLLNPHDIMYANANIPGTPQAQNGFAPVTLPAPDDVLYKKRWQFPLPISLQQSLTAKDMPSALSEYQNGWSSTFGFIPTSRRDMWTNYYNYYLNAIQDDDRKIQEITNTLSDMDLWKNTIVIFTADHGDMGGTHGGLRGKGPMAYEENAHIPLIIAHPKGLHGATCNALTSHLDMLPTMIGLTQQTLSSPIHLSGHDFTKLITLPNRCKINAVREGVLFNYVGLSTVDSHFLIKAMNTDFVDHHAPFPSLSELNTQKRGFLSFTFDGHYKFARYYAPDDFNTPTTIDELYQHNDVQLFDLQTDPNELHNLAMNPVKYKTVILRMNKLLNTLMAKEVGDNNGEFLPNGVRR